MKFAFFGTPEIARTALQALSTAGLMPELVITNPDAPVGRKQIMTPPPAKVWAEAASVPVFQPNSLREDSVSELFNTHTFDVCVVVAYGKIIPASLLVKPRHGFVNLHPSLLPKFRGASPIRSAILADDRLTGVSVMLLDEEMDHGPVIAQEEVKIPASEWPLKGRDLDQRLAEAGGRFLADTLPRYVKGEAVPIPQNHSAATYCTKITKDMGQLDLDPKALPQGALAYEYLLKVRAFDVWPETFFMHEGKRIKIKEAEIINGYFTPTRVIPEGAKEINFYDYNW